MPRRTPGRTAGFANRPLTRSPFAFPRDTPGSERNKLLRHAGNPRDAVRNGLTRPWSSEVVEGSVNRIKIIKRQMCGGAASGHALVVGGRVWRVVARTAGGGLARRPAGAHLRLIRRRALSRAGNSM